MGRPPKEVSQEKIQRFQMELELAGEDTDLLLKDKKGRSRSCLLCQRRKQKCDHKIPSCTACLKAGVRCIQPAKYGSNTASGVHSGNGADSGPRVATVGDKICNLDNGAYHRQKTDYHCRTNTNDVNGTGSCGLKADCGTGLDMARSRNVVKPSGSISNIKNRNANGGKDEYTLFLEKKLKYLEKLIDLPPESASYKNKLGKYKKITHFLKSGSEEIEELIFSEKKLNNDFKMDARIYPNANIADFLSFGKQRDDIDGRFGFASQYRQPIDYSKSIFAKYELHDLLSHEPGIGVDEKLSRALLDTYFNRIQSKYPLLDEQEIYKFHEDYITDNLSEYSLNDYHFYSGRMWMVFSVAACIHITIGRSLTLSPHRFFSTAIHYVSKCGTALSLFQQLEILTLLVFYVIRRDKDSVGYDIIKDVINISKNKLYLHKRTSSDNFASRKKLRLFWSVYLLERMICVSIGKPYTISESEIELPIFSETTVKADGSESYVGNICGNHCIDQVLQLRRIESRFVETLQIIPQTGEEHRGASQFPTRGKLTEQLSILRSFFHELEIWKFKFCDTQARNIENETLKLNYYLSVRLLIQPYLELLEPEDRLFRECQAAAGHICQLYKFYHQTSVSVHSTLSIHSIFGAGVTLIYCMWLTRNGDEESRRNFVDASRHTKKPLFNASLFSTMDGLRACSVCLYVMAEKSKFAVKLRDIFDQLMNATTANLTESYGPDSSELVYVTNSNNTSRRDHLNPISVGLRAELGENGSEIRSATSERAFCKLSDNENMGFMGNTQSHPNKKDRMNKIKHSPMLMAQVPKSLPHLLASITNDMRDLIPDGTAVSSSEVSDSKRQKTEPRDRTQLELSNSSNVFLESCKESQYVTRKTANTADSDWRMFQQQALSQQQYAQQTLQAYLSSLNRRNNVPSTVSDVIDTHEQQQQQQQQPICINASGIVLFDVRSGLSSTANSAPPSNAAHVSAYGSLHDVLQGMDLNSMNHCSQSNSIIPNVLLGTLGAGSPFAVSNGDICLSNNTQNMINNISTWSNNSTIDFLNSNRDTFLSDQQPQPTANVCSHPSSHFLNNHHKLYTVPNRDNNPHISATSQWKVPFVFPPQSHGSGSLAPGQQTPTQNTLDAFWTVPMEDFWASADYYGFLT
ncbi:uncharacterized protein Ecym_3112 [Eremothecium cymbalariae DBVPG|uniref:Zn(2)-C6 fungal-type domain-containing protein n=1 Tax=Eremothecium cymbalariae (strain CBS 270.75 / DBVPG 7215 / KCTC 17166 / NRRL Y-17582) TaxID=931890 RepID=G8JR51_ERECY|nr:Hypothetical protein Ecym_3112 [Eremothecium cymbalariae DBVPG\